jgi:Protein of unknwon function (DUF3310)
MKPSKDQVGGQHYKSMPIQPAEFIHKNGIGFLEGNVIKYVCRHATKSGKEDLLKARHYIDLLLEWQYPVPALAPAIPDAPYAKLAQPLAGKLESKCELPYDPEQKLATCKCGKLICKMCKFP